MTAIQIIEQASADGVTLALAPSGSIKATGEQIAVNRWLSRILDNKPGIVEVLAESFTAWHWLVHFAGRDPLEVYCDPHETHAGILKCYPGALAAEPIPERIKRVFTEAENAEWEALWLDPLDWDGPTPEAVSTDDRRRCTQCKRLNPLGRCITAQRGEIAATQTYEPIRDILRRCEGYMPRADDPDTRPGRERWPELIEKHTRRETLQ